MKLISKRKIKANHDNSALSTGPVSPVGKRTSSRNSFKHGIFAKDLFLSDDEKVEFEDLSSALRSQLKPATKLQEIAFGRVTCACWRCRLATRLEMSRIRKHLAVDLAQGSDGSPTPETRPPSRWYGSSRSELQAARRYFAELREEIAVNGFCHHEEWKDPLIKACGNQEFFDSLMRLKPEANTQDILMLEALSAKSQMYQTQLPPDFQPDSEHARVVAESRLKWRMAIQLVEDRMQHLEDLARMNIVPGDASEHGRGDGTLDGISRYLTTTTRELERAVRWFQELKNQGL